MSLLISQSINCNSSSVAPSSGHNRVLSALQPCAPSLCNSGATFSSSEKSLSLELHVISTSSLALLLVSTNLRAPKFVSPKPEARTQKRSEILLHT